MVLLHGCQLLATQRVLISILKRGRKLLSYRKRNGSLTVRWYCLPRLCWDGLEEDAKGLQHMANNARRNADHNVLLEELRFVSNGCGDRYRQKQQRTRRQRKRQTYAGSFNLHYAARITVPRWKTNNSSEPQFSTKTKSKSWVKCSNVC